MSKIFFDSVKPSDAKLRMGAWCKSLRQRKGISQEELATNLNLSRVTIHHLESGRNSTLETFLKVLYYFQELESLYTYIAEKTAEKDVKSLY
jgi:transcriptional regulator with XRE-family HTH domain